MKTVLPGQGFRFDLDGRSLTIEDVVTFSRRSEYASCALSAEAMENIRTTRALTAFFSVVDPLHNERRRTLIRNSFRKRS